MKITTNLNKQPIFFDNPKEPYFYFNNRKYYLCDFEHYKHPLWNARGAVKSLADIFLKLIDDDKPKVIIGLFEG